MLQIAVISLRQLSIGISPAQGGAFIHAVQIPGFVLWLQIQ